MRQLKTVFFLFFFSLVASPSFAQDATCCERLQQEIRVLKEQQDKLFHNLQHDEKAEKQGFGFIERLMELLSGKFPELKDMREKLQKIKEGYDLLSK